MPAVVWNGPVAAAPIRDIGAPTRVAEWPDGQLDVDALMASGWRPVPINEFVLKVVGRCNLACDYCYVYAMADQSWRTRPPVMRRATIVRAAARIGEHARRHGLERVRVILHGGEPLLAGADELDFVASTVRRNLPPAVAVDFHIQTNGVLLSEAHLRTMHAHQIRVGVSLDGGRSSHDRHRRWRTGAGSYQQTAHGLRLLGQPRHRPLFAGLLCVVDLANDPLEVYQALLGFAPPAIDFLLPHGNWSSPPAGRAPGTPYADWLIRVFSRWYHATRMETDVRLFQDIISLVLGGHGRSEQVGLSPATFLVIDTDGTIQQTDALKSTFAGGPDTGFNVFDHPISAVQSHPSVVARQIGRAALADECHACPIVTACGGGHYAHRYRRGVGFRQPTVYCPDLLKLIGHIRDCLTADVQKLAA